MNQRNKITLQPAYILHHRPYRDTSLLLEIFSYEYGRIGLVAKGARAPKSRNKSLFQPFKPLLISWTARGELGTLTGIEAASADFVASGNRILSGFYINELILKLLHRNDPHSELFEVYIDTMKTLFSDTDEQLTLRLFEKRLLHQLGYALLLDTEEDTGKRVEESLQYDYVPEQGPRQFNGDAVYGVTISGGTLLSLHNECVMPSQNLLEAKRLMRLVLAHYGGIHSMKTRNVLKNMNACLMQV